jgi:hypothetical protein
VVLFPCTFTVCSLIAKSCIKPNPDELALKNMTWDLDTVACGSANITSGSQCNTKCLGHFVSNGKPWICTEGQWSDDQRCGNERHADLSRVFSYQGVLLQRILRTESLVLDLFLLLELPVNSHAQLGTQ